MVATVGAGWRTRCSFYCAVVAALDKNPSLLLTPIHENDIPSLGLTINPVLRKLGASMIGPAQRAQTCIDSGEGA
jgi:hypothetical protein